MRLIYIHGINNEANTKGSIESDWTEAIKKGLALIGKELPDNFSWEAAYYGKLLDQEARSWKKNENSQVQTMGVEDSVAEYVTSEGDLYMEYLRDHNVTREQIIKSLDECEKVPTTDMMAKGIHKKWLKAIARALEKVLPTRGKFAARIFLKQASAYLQKKGLKEKIDDKVFNQIFKDKNLDDNICVISHSLGTIVGYTLLRQSANTLKAKAFFTLGSPLGIEIVKKALGNPKICLPNVGAWINFSDKEDFVALKPELNTETFWCGEIENHTFIDNGHADAHSIEMYLSQPAFARRFSQLLGF